jgi:hypothetical protein
VTLTVTARHGGAPVVGEMNSQSNACKQIMAFTSQLQYPLNSKNIKYNFAMQNNCNKKEVQTVHT